MAQLPALLIGALIPVLAWRLGADVAAELGLPEGRARTLAAGVGLTAAVELPLVLFSALPDSTGLFAALVLGACLLITRLLRDPRGARIGDPRLPWPGRPDRPGRADPQRGTLAGPGLGRPGLVHRPRQRRRPVAPGRAAAPRVRRGGRGPDRVHALAIRDWLVFGNPLPGQAAANALSVTGFDIFAWSDPPTLSRYLAAGLGTLVQMRIDGLHPQPGQRPAPAELPDRLDRRPAPALDRPDPGASPPPCRVPGHLLGDHPRLPGGNHVGHVPARRRSGPRPVDRGLPAGPRRAVRAAQRVPGLEQGGGLAGRDPDRRDGRPVQPDPRRLRHPEHQRGQPLRGSRGPARRSRPAPRPGRRHR